MHDIARLQATNHYNQCLAWYSALYLALRNPKLQQLCQNALYIGLNHISELRGGKKTAPSKAPATLNLESKTATITLERPLLRFQQYFGMRNDQSTTSFAKPATWDSASQTATILSERPPLGIQHRVGHAK